MKSGFIAVASSLSLFIIAGSAHPLPQQTTVNAHSVWLEARIREMELIKVGTTRREVMKVLQEDKGGWQAYEQRSSYRYQNPACDSIKVDVSFKLARSSKTNTNYMDDIVTKVSHPYLDLVPNRARW